MQKLNKCTYQVFALIYYGDVVNPFCFLCKLPNLHIWFWTNILIQYGKHHCALKNAKKWFCEILELLTFCAKVTMYELRYEISNNVVCATSKGTDQTAHARSLIRAFASGLNILWVLSLFDLILYVPSTIFQLYRDRSFWVEPVLS